MSGATLLGAVAFWVSSPNWLGQEVMSMLGDIFPLTTLSSGGILILSSLSMDAFQFGRI